jgi:hypothetical protein
MDTDRLVVAEIYRVADGKLYDMAWAWQAGQSYAADPAYLVLAVADDGPMGAAEAQRLYDYERRLAQDCWDL